MYSFYVDIMGLPHNLVLELDIVTLQKLTENKAAYDSWLSYKEAEALEESNG